MERRKVVPSGQWNSICDEVNGKKFTILLLQLMAGLKNIWGPAAALVD